MKKTGHSQAEIVAALGRSSSTISQELRRNQGRRGYRPKQAQRLSDTRRREVPKAIKMTEEVKGWLSILVRQDLSPQQAAAYLGMERGISLHHETLYQWPVKRIGRDKAEGGNLYRHLRIASKRYRKRYGSYNQRGKIKGRVDISERLAIVDARSRIGDWEGDTVVGWVVRVHC